MGQARKEILARMRKVKYGDIVLSDDHNTLVDYADAVDKDLDALALAEVNLTKVSGVEQTGADWTNYFSKLEYVPPPTHRLASSGWISVVPKKSIFWLDVSGKGYAIQLFRFDGRYLPAANIWSTFRCDNLHERLISLPDIAWSHGWGYTSVGDYSLGSKHLKIATWDTAALYFCIHHLSEPPPVPFSSSLVHEFYNNHPTDTGEYLAEVVYSVYGSSKRVLLKLPERIPADAVRRIVTHRATSVEMKLVGYFDRIEDHPYREFLEAFPNEERNIKEPLIACEITAPDIPTNEIVGRLRYERMVYEWTL